MKIDLPAKQRLTRKQRREMLIDRLGGKCFDCGTEKNLHFHHLDKETKSFTIAVGLQKPIDELIEEADKCQLLCSSCHMHRHKGYSVHGTVSYYKNRGCRCTLCKNAHAENMRRYMLARATTA